MSNTVDALKAIKLALSPGRLGTYEAAAHVHSLDNPGAIALYAWNAQVSAAFFLPLHICEVVIRNAVSDALDSVYGPLWPWNSQFILSLADVTPGHGYSPRADIRRVNSEQLTTGKVIPELKFAFWEQMFTRRHDVRLWTTELKRVFPNHNPNHHFARIRKRVYADLTVLRPLRNRIAHHEPIFARNLLEDYARLVDLVALRSNDVVSWMHCNQSLTTLLSTPPLFRGGVMWTPTHDEVAAVAYARWNANGTGQDTAIEDWYAALAFLTR